MTPIIAAVVLVTTAGIASAQLGAGPLASHTRAHAKLAPAGTRGAAAVVLPLVMPPRDADHPESRGFRTSAQFARHQAAAAAPAQGATASAGASASITVTATVLPVRTIVVGSDDQVTDIWSNTPELGARSSLFVVRRGSVGGAVVPMTRTTWLQVRTVLARAQQSTGHVYGSGN